jgi:hypothetical protein
MQIRHRIKEFPAKRLFSFYSYLYGKITLLPKPSNSSYLLNKLNHEKASFIICHIHFFMVLATAQIQPDATTVQAF